MTAVHPQPLPPAIPLVERAALDLPQPARLDFLTLLRGELLALQPNNALAAVIGANPTASGLDPDALREVL